MTAKQLARLSGTSVRTLHHYDQKGLLCPLRNGENGYREYTRGDLERLQQILFFKACGFSLSHIKTLLDSPGFDRMEAYELQKKSLLHERGRIDAMLKTLERSMQHLKGEISMDDKERFAGFDFGDNPYEEEARQRWGDKAVENSNAYVKSLGKAGRQQLGEEFDALFRELAALREQDPAGEAAQAAMARMFEYFNTSFGVTYSPEAFGNLGRMYVEDARFTKNIDRYGEGLAAFLAKAMPLYAESL